MRMKRRRLVCQGVHCWCEVVFGLERRLLGCWPGVLLVREWVGQDRLFQVHPLISFKRAISQRSSQLPLPIVTVAILARLRASHLRLLAMISFIRSQKT